MGSSKPPVSAPCPSGEALKAFAVGDLGEAKLEQIAAHVASCSRCDASLQALDKYADGLLTDLNQLRTVPAAAPEPEMPERLVHVALSAAAEDGDASHRSDRDLALDPGRRIARKLAAGHCRLGRFELEAELGVGAFGYVFRARDTELDRLVALKVQRAGSFASEEEIERFLREARSVAQLKHPAIVALYDTVHTEEDVCFLVTEYIEGDTLEKRLQTTRFDDRSAAGLVAAIADALQYAHEQGVIHRDVKPSNILLDAQGRPHLMDFGLAKRDVAETITSDGRLMGTPAYMSPEQARGQSHDIDARSDVYSLGVVLYELLTGERPFQGNRRMLLLQVLEEEPRPPRQLNDKIPRDVETICLKAMAKSPTWRYASTGELAADLRRYLAGEAIAARPIGRAERLWRWCRRYPLAASLLVAVSLGSALGFWHLSRLSEHFVRETALDSARMEAEMLERLRDYFSDDVVAHLDASKVQVHHEYAALNKKQKDGKGNAIPVPTTLLIDAAERMSRPSGMQVRLYSDRPWRTPAPEQDDFERRALGVLRTRVAAQETDLSYHEFSKRGDQPVVRFAKAQVMQTSCLGCHRNKPSPKLDWNVGDLAGVLEVTRPLDQDIDRTRKGLRESFILMGSVAASLVLVSLVLLFRKRS